MGEPMFGLPESDQNGELSFYNKIKDSCSIIFDVGCRSDTIFGDFDGIVHYFDPAPESISILENLNNKNKLSFFNTFGLGNANKQLVYYPRYQSFLNRTESVGIDASKEGRILEIRKGTDYMIEKNITTIDFMKIDTEGFELEVLKGFEENLKNTKIIQFEYGSASLDNSFKLNDIIKYLEKYEFHKFSYLHKTGKTKLEDLKGMTITTDVVWHKHGLQHEVKYIEEDGFVPDHYNYCNIVCINKNCDLQHFF